MVTQKDINKHVFLVKQTLSTVKWADRVVRRLPLFFAAYIIYLIYLLAAPSLEAAGKEVWNIPAPHIALTTCLMVIALLHTAFTYFYNTVNDAVTELLNNKLRNLETVIKSASSRESDDNGVEYSEGLFTSLRLAVENIKDGKIKHEGRLSYAINVIFLMLNTVICFQ